MLILDAALRELPKFVHGPPLNVRGETDVFADTQLPFQPPFPFSFFVP